MSKAREWWIYRAGKLTLASVDQPPMLAKAIHVREVLPDTITISREELAATLERLTTNCVFPGAHFMHVPIDSLMAELFGPLASHDKDDQHR